MGGVPRLSPSRRLATAVSTAARVAGAKSVLARNVSTRDCATKLTIFFASPSGSSGRRTSGSCQAITSIASSIRLFRVSSRILAPLLASRLVMASWLFDPAMTLATCSLTLQRHEMAMRAPWTGELRANKSKSSFVRTGEYSRTGKQTDCASSFASFSIRS